MFKYSKNAKRKMKHEKKNKEKKPSLKTLLNLCSWICQPVGNLRIVQQFNILNQISQRIWIIRSNLKRKEREIKIQKNFQWTFLTAPLFVATVTTTTTTTYGTKLFVFVTVVFFCFNFSKNLFVKLFVLLRHNIVSFIDEFVDIFSRVFIRWYRR